MKYFLGLWLFAFGVARFAASLECPACDTSRCPYGFTEEVDEKGCPTCECLECKACSDYCIYGFREFDTKGTLLLFHI